MDKANAPKAKDTAQMWLACFSSVAVPTLCMTDASQRITTTCDMMSRLDS